MKQYSLRVKMLGLLLGLYVLSISATFYLEYRAQSFMSRSYHEALQGNVEALAQAVAAQFYERYGDVQAFAANEALWNGSKAQVTRALNDYVRLYGIYDLIVLVDPNGRLIAANTVDSKGRSIDEAKLKARDFRNESWFRNSISAEFTNDSTKGLMGTLFEGPHLDELLKDATGESRWSASFSTIVKDRSGKVLGVLSNRSGFGWAEKEFQLAYEMLKRQELETASFSLIDGKGIVLLSYDPSAEGNKLEINHDYNIVGKKNLIDLGLEAARNAHEGHAGSLSTVDEHGEPIVAGYTPIHSEKFVDSLGWSVIGSIDVEDRMGDFRRSSNMIHLVVGVIWLSLFGFTYMYLQSLAGQFRDLTRRLAKGAEESQAAARDVLDNSKHLHADSTSQASAVEETSAAVTEIASMLANTSQLAASASESSVAVKTHTEDGAKAIANIGAAMEEIGTSSKELGAIGGIIAEIASKTKVINDIVFETRLLSFNASIEAARAGSHGRGFAVVAEEIGKLASTSGRAAQEIDSLLSNSQSKVAGIIKATSESIYGGREVSNKAILVFEEIARAANSISEQIHSISAGTREQDTGIQQISTATQQIGRSSHEGLNSSSRLAAIAESLKSKADEVSSSSQELTALLLGSKGEVSTTMKERVEVKSLAEQGSTHAARQHENPVANDGPKPETVSEDLGIAKSAEQHESSYSSPSKEVTPARQDSRWKSAA